MTFWENLHALAQIIRLVASGLILVYIVLLFTRVGGFAFFVHILPFLSGGLFILSIDDTTHRDYIAALLDLGAGMFFAYLWGNDDDNPWKKHRKRAKERIVRRGNKLVTQPIPNES